MSHSRRTSLFALLVLVATFVALAPAEAARSRCFGKRATIVGTAQGDRLTGTPARDVIVGKGGGDTITARGGNDLVCAGRGRDSVDLGGGGDRASGGVGTDGIIGGGGADRISLEGGGDEFAAGAGGNDVIDLGPGLFQIAVGGSGDDRIIGFTPEAGVSLDLVSYLDASGPVTVDLAAGQATGHGTDTLVSIDGVEGGEFDDTLTGHAGSNFLFGGPGNDVINDGGNEGSFELGPEGVLAGFRFDAMGGDFSDAPPGNDTFIGEGAGLHVVFYDTPGGVTVDLQAGTATGEGTDTLTGINAAAAGRGDDTLRGDGNANGFDGGAGTDVLDGRGGEDTVILFDAVGAVADLTAGTATGQYLTFTEQGEEDRPFTWTLAGFENLWGSTRSGDTLRGDGGPNEIFGVNGPDQLFGLAGADLLNGGAGSDTGDGGEGSDECISVETPTNCESTGSAAADRAILPDVRSVFGRGLAAIRVAVLASR